MNLLDYATAKGISFVGIPENGGIEALQELDTDSNCGKDCVRVIDATASLIATLDPSVNTNGIKAAALAGIEVFYFG